MKKILTILLLLLIPAAVFSFDFGIMTNHYYGYANDHIYRGAIVPRFSVPLGEHTEFIISASLSLGFDDVYFKYLELLRTEFNVHKGNWGFKVGRINFNDPSGYIINGLFDGMEFNYNSRIGRFNFGGWYSGFIFKKTSYITMTPTDEERHALDVSYDHDFRATYFSSRRLIFGVGWEHTSIAESMKLNVTLLRQFDLNISNERVDSQYFIFRMGLPEKRFSFELGGCLGSFQYMSFVNPSGFTFGYAFDMTIHWVLPTPFYSRLSFSSALFSGSTSDFIGPFNQITNVYIGNVFFVKRAALAAYTLDYSARILNTLGASVSTTYFIRTDLTTGVYPVSGTEKDGYYLGPEVYTKVVWGPLSDIQVTAGGGVFFPKLGNNWPDAKPIWRLDITAIFAVM